MSKRVAVVGTGYVGLTTGACLAHLGHDVVCADVDAGKVERLSRGEIPIVEHDLDKIVERGISTGRLRFVVGAAEAVKNAEIVFICVPTPQDEDGSADLSYVEAAAREIATTIPYEAIVVNKSTVPVGSTRVVAQAMQRSDIKVVSNPEFLREGSAVQDFLHPDRIVVGSDDHAAAVAVADLYGDIIAPRVVTDPASAETIKYAANAFLATKLSFVNAVAAICEGVGADVNDVVLGLGYDKRIGHEFLKPGPGWGGSCFDGAETLVVRSLGEVRMIRFDELATAVTDARSPIEVLAWAPDSPRPEFMPLQAATQRDYTGDMISLRTKMGRRLKVTADHPMVAKRWGDEPSVLQAGELTTEHWVPVALGTPLHDELPSSAGFIVDAALESTKDLDEYWETVGARLTRQGSGILHRIPDLAWHASDSQRQALLRGLWRGDGSWSKVAGGPSVVLEYGTVSRELADGMVRMLGEFGIVARVKIGRGAKSTVDTYWLTISGADQIEQAQFLLEPDEAIEVQALLGQQTKRIAPTGYRLDGKGTAWVRVTDTARVATSQTVYSAEVAHHHTIVTSFGLVAHNCFPKDTYALINIADNAGYEFHLLRGVIAVNDEQFERVVGKIAEGAGGDLNGKTVAVWGLTFKARTDDLRESPSISIIERLLAAGANVQAFDPTVTAVKGPIPAAVSIAADPYAATAGADVLAVLTEWDDFRWLDAGKVASEMPGRTVVDARNLLDRGEWRRAGFTHLGIGR